MPSTIFRFKEFEVDQGLTAMKVGTDSVLLGSWVNLANAKTILDVGTGTGLIAMMMAQRSDAFIDAVELDPNSYHQAKFNFSHCKWAERISAIHDSIQHYSTSISKKYDIIVSNPPFFVNSFKSPTDNRNLARHTDLLSHAELIEGALKLLNTRGRLSLILPKTEGDFFIKLAKEAGLFCTKISAVRPKKEKPIKRYLIQFETTQNQLIEDELIIENEQRHSYTNEYANLTRMYYLNL